MYTNKLLLVLQFFLGKKEFSNRNQQQSSKSPLGQHTDQVRIGIFGYTKVSMHLNFSLMFLSFFLDRMDVFYIKLICNIFYICTGCPNITTTIYKRPREPSEWGRCVYLFHNSRSNWDNSICINFFATNVVNCYINLKCLAKVSIQKRGFYWTLS